MDKLVITAAICGAEVMKEQSPVVPYTIEEIAEEAYLAHQAGAAIIHLHVRNDDGTPTQDKERYEKAILAIKERCPSVIIQPSTGGAVGMTIEERSQPLELNPEMATLDSGTLNFGGDEIFVNTENDILAFYKEMNKKGIKPEFECFEKGHIDMILRHVKKGNIKEPIHFSFVLGVNGGMSGSLRDFMFMRNSIPNNATYTVAGIGRFEFPLAVASIIDGGHVRVGLEDNIYLSKGQLAKSNAELVAKVVRLAKELGRDVATSDEARDILGINREE